MKDWLCLVDLWDECDRSVHCYKPVNVLGGQFMIQHDPVTTTHQGSIWLTLEDTENVLESIRATGLHE